MGRNEPLGLHDQALKYMLEVRGDDQLYSSRRFCLARIAIYRLQARCLLLGEEGGALQQTLLDALNQNRPDLRIMYNVSQIQRLCAKADWLVHHWEQEPREQAAEQVGALLQEIEEMTSSIESWTSTVDARLRPLPESPDEVDRFQHITLSHQDHPLKYFSCPRMLKHHDTSVAFLWSFYAAAQVILRDSTVQVLRLAAILLPDNAQQYLDRMHWEKMAIEMLSSAIVQSFPKLMGFDEARWDDDAPSDLPSQASSLGRFLGVFSLVVVRRTEATSQAHKECAGRVLAWLHKSALNSR